MRLHGIATGVMGLCLLSPAASLQAEIIIEDTFTGYPDNALISDDPAGPATGLSGNWTLVPTNDFYVNKTQADDDAGTGKAVYDRVSTDNGARTATRNTSAEHVLFETDGDLFYASFLIDPARAGGDMTFELELVRLDGGGAVDLSFGISGGTYIVGNGGINSLVSGGTVTADEQLIVVRIEYGDTSTGGMDDDEVVTVWIDPVDESSLPVIDGVSTELLNSGGGKIASVSIRGDQMDGLPAFFDDLRVGLSFAVVGSGNTVQEAFYPAAASLAGLSGTFWTTDGWFHSTAANPVDLYGAFLPGGGQDNSVAVADLVMLGTIPAGGSLVVVDIVAMLGGDGKTGGVFLRAEAAGGTSLPFLYATSYTSTPNPEGGGSFGQGIPAVESDAKVMTIAPGAFQNAERRTNAGVLNTSDQTITVLVRVIDDIGATVATATWTLEPYGQRQVSLPNLGVQQLNGGSVVFEKTSSEGYFRGYASTIDAITGDAVYNAAQ